MWESHLATGFRRLKVVTPFDPVIPIMGINPKGIVQNKAEDLPPSVTALFVFT